MTIIRFCIAASAALAVAAPSFAAFGVNLITNPGAEAGAGSPSGDTVPVPGWTTTGNATAVVYGAPGGFPTATDPGPTDRGENFFAGGPNNGSSSLSQTIVIDLADLAAIDAGLVTFDLGGFLGGFGGQGDNAVLTAVFRGTGGTNLGSASIGPVTTADRGSATGLLFRDTNGGVAVGTRSIDLTLQLTRTAGSYNDGYADNLSLVL